LQDKFYEMVKDKLIPGLVVKNYKEMCELLDEEIKGGGRTKSFQFDRWQRYFDYEKDGQKFIITKIYDIPIPEPQKLYNRKDYEQFRISIEDEHKTGVYSIILNNNIYIGSTIKSFRERFKKHTYKDNPLPTYNMIHKGGIFEIIWIAEEGTDKLTIRQKEKEYIQYYKTLGNWNIINFRYMSNKIKLVSKYKYIKVGKKDYNIAIKLLQKNNIHIKLNKEEITY